MGDIGNFPDKRLLHYLALGLPHLYKIMVAKTYDERAGALRSEERMSEKRLGRFDRGQPRKKQTFLVGLLGEQMYTHLGGPPAPAIVDISVRRPFYDDGDPGPKKICEHLIQKVELEFGFRGFFGGRDLLYRMWGSTMWDNARLQALHVFQEPLKEKKSDIACDTSESLESMADEWSRSWDREWERSREEWQRSCDARSEIYQEGGRGWWDENDESHVVWAFKKPHTSPSIRSAESLKELKSVCNKELNSAWYARVERFLGAK